ncbi:acetolactate synthase small subunit [Halanaeroarchaeum sulfurireducens]|uniref:Acetolactate synthase small subunit n=2 Tax=Halanaeroarchaeum sulfurireducens TaxID=1604004 RepID=A0A0F7PAZ8_9EURY|nr:acetolactate synthase small subunit [Halanaeroarchaeum sulfurireducens]ALG82725.1 acetolactate synthase small subunit [Halanaeroarchaeum sulfurireducens]
MHGPSPEERPTVEGKRNAQGIRIDPEAVAEPEPRRVVISALVDHEPGVLAKVSGLFARRQFNIESLTVGPTSNPELARMTIVAEEPTPGIEQVKRQLRKEVATHSVREVEGAIERELALIKVRGDDPAGVAAVAQMYGGEAVQTGAEVVTVELTGTEEQIDEAIEAFQRFGVREVDRTGTAALTAGSEPTA